MFKIWLDADSCPSAVRVIIVRAAEREELVCTFVANREIPHKKSGLVEMVVVPAKEGAADDYIVDNVRKSDLAVTRDIPLAARLLEKGAVILNDRGERFTNENIREKLSIRDFMYEMRFSGIKDPGNRQFGQKETQKFANCFDRELRKLLKEAAENDKT